MNHFHKRVVVLHYDEASLPTFETQEEVDDWHRAVGRMVTYALTKGAEEDKIDLVSIGIQQPLELFGAFHAPVPAYLRWEDGSIRVLGSADDKVMSAASELRGRQPFVMAAVKGMDGKFGFHS